MDLTKNELQFMTVLWCADAALTAAEILKRSVDKEWKDASLHTILNNLLEKGAVAEHGFVKDGKIIARTFVPAVSREVYYKNFFAGHMTEDIPMLLSALMDRTDIDAETINKLAAIIQDRQAGMGH